MSGMPRVIVMGGSIGGLTAALVLRDAGCDVRVLERSSTELTARGAGIAALSTTLAYLVKRGGFQARDVCSATDWIRFLHRDGTAAVRAAAPVPVLVLEHDLPVPARPLRRRPVPAGRRR